MSEKVNEYRKKNRRCITCQHYYRDKYEITSQCMAKNTRMLVNRLSGVFCKLYEAKEYRA